MRPHDFHFILKRRRQVFSLAKSSKRHSFHLFFFFCILQQGLTWPRLALSSMHSEVGLELHISASTSCWCDHRVLRKASLTQKSQKKHRSHMEENLSKVKV